MSKKEVTLEVTRYFIDKDGAIKITHVKVIEDGKYKKFAKLKDLLPHIHKYKVVWKELDQ